MTPENTTHATKSTPKRNPKTVTFLLVLLAVGAITATVINVRFAQNTGYRTHIQQGVTFVEAKEARKAEIEFRSALKLRPDLAEPYRLLARLYMETQLPEQAIPLFTRLREIAPQTEHSACGLTEAYARAGNDKKATELARQAVTIEPNCANAHALLGIALANQLETKQGLEELKKAGQLEPNNQKRAMSLAQAYLDSNDLPAAEKVARDASARDPNYPTAYSTLGRAYSRRTPTPENLKEGITAFEKAVKLKPEWGDAFSELGRLRLLAGDTKGAIEALEYLEKKKVRTEDSTFNLAQAYRKIGDFKKAAVLTKEFKRISDFYAKYDSLRKRLALTPNDPDLAIQVAECEIELRNWNDADLLLQGVLRTRPKDPRALKAAVRLYEGNGNKQLSDAYKARLTTDTGETKKP